MSVPKPLLSFFEISMTNFWLMLPVEILVISMASSYVRQIRVAILEELNSNYVM